MIKYLFIVIAIIKYLFIVIALFQYLFIVLLKSRQVFPGLGELALLHSLANIPGIGREIERSLILTVREMRESKRQRGRENETR